MPADRVTQRLMTPRSGVGGAATGAIAIIQLESGSPDALDGLLERAGLADLPIGTVSLRDLLGIDHGLVCRWSGSCAQLMPHGGAIVVSQLEEGLRALGVEDDGDDSLDALTRRHPEARDAIEACAIDAIARAASPDAIDMIVAHADRARSSGGGGGQIFDDSLAVLDALIEPPIVACVGRANVGKSSLLNALAGRSVAVVADEPGTTRDHVGVHLDLGGLVVRFIDTPGYRPNADPIERQAHTIAHTLIESADLVLSCGDATADPISILHPPNISAPSAALRGDPSSPTRPATLTIATRRDLGTPSFAHDVAVGGLDTQSPTGLVDLIARMRAIQIGRASCRERV